MPLTGVVAAGVAAPAATAAGRVSSRLWSRMMPDTAEASPVFNDGAFDGATTLCPWYR